MKSLCTLLSLMFLAVVVGCGDSYTPDKTGVAPPKSPEETSKEIEEKMKQKGINAQTYGKSQPTTPAPSK